MPTLKKLLRTKYDFVCGIGNDCGCAGHLIKARLRRASYPLDWVGTWSIRMTDVAKLVENDFADFLHLENLQILPLPPPVDTPEGRLDDAHHLWCGDVATRIVIPHDFPMGRSLAESFPGVRKKYDRRIKRFYQTMSESRRALFVYWTWRSHTDEDDILAAAKIFRSKFQGHQVDLLVIRHDDRKDIDARAIGEGVFLVDGPVHPPGANPAFGDFALNARLFSQIRLRGKRRALLRERLVRLAMRVKSAFIFDREKRHAYRERLGGARGGFHRPGQLSPAQR